MSEGDQMNEAETDGLTTACKRDPWAEIEVLRAENARLRALTVDDPTSIYHEHDHLRTAMAELNRLRSNVIATQSASWSNAVYPMVAILDRAGFELIRDVTPEDMADHMLCYGGAGGSPDHLTPDARKGDLWRQRLAEAKERGAQELRAGPQVGGTRQRQGPETAVTDSDQSGTTSAGLLVGVLWVGAIAAAVGTVWTLPATGDVRAWRWIGTAVVLFVAMLITALVVDW